MTLYSLASSSSGNCYLYDFDEYKILVDLGISYKGLNEKLSDINIDIKDIDAVFITHEHSDHIKGVEVFNKKNDIPVYVTEGTESALKFPLNNKINVKANSNILFDNMQINIFPTSHDANEPVCFLFEHNNKKYGHITDTGYLSRDLQENFNNLHFYLLESNYDERALLTNEKYPFNVKKRINSDIGHLSNIQTNQYLKDIIGENTETICLGHLSENNNDIELVEILNENIEIDKYILKKEEIVKVLCK